MKKRNKTKLLSFVVCFAMLMYFFTFIIPSEKVNAVGIEMWVLVDAPYLGEIKESNQTTEILSLKERKIEMSIGSASYHTNVEWNRKKSPGISPLSGTAISDFTVTYEIPETMTPGEKTSFDFIGTNKYDLKETEGKNPELYLNKPSFSVTAHQIEKLDNGAWASSSGGILYNSRYVNPDLNSSQTGNYTLNSPQKNSTIKNFGFICEINGPWGRQQQIYIYEYKKMEVNTELKIEEVDSGARFSSISRQVEFRHQGETDEADWQFATIETELMVGDHIKTSMESSCTISFKDMSTYTMKAETEIVIAAQKADDTKLKLVLGKIWANVKRMAKDGKLEIETTQCVAGIKGTIFSVEATKDKTILEVLEGSVEFTCLASGEKTFVESGKTAFGNIKLSPVTAFDTTKDKTYWDKVATVNTATSGNIASSKATTENEKNDSGFLWFIIIGFIIVIIIIAFLFISKKKNK